MMMIDGGFASAAGLGYHTSREKTTYDSAERFYDVKRTVLHTERTILQTEKGCRARQNGLYTPENAILL